MIRALGFYVYAKIRVTAVHDYVDASIKKGMNIHY